MLVAVFVIGCAMHERGGASAPGPAVFLMGMVDGR